GQITRVVLLNMTLANWNGGDVEAADLPAKVDAMIPETGTVFRMETTKPNFASDVFVLKTESAKLLTKTFDIDNVKVWPNPYFGYNPEERNPLDQQMHFTHLPETGECKIRIFDLAGDLVRIINHNNTGSQYAIWELKNTVGKYVASGIYIAHVKAENESIILKLAVIQPAK
ncbi:MAG: T9SS type A sorting domain-containing protein, partial [Candidatus Neomarinimicrobiota bacterium]